MVTGNDWQIAFSQFNSTYLSCIAQLHVLIPLHSYENHITDRNLQKKVLGKCSAFLSLCRRNHFCVLISFVFCCFRCLISSIPIEFQAEFRLQLWTELCIFYLFFYRPDYRKLDFGQNVNYDHFAFTLRNDLSSNSKLAAAYFLRLPLFPPK